MSRQSFFARFDTFLKSLELDTKPMSPQRMNCSVLQERRTRSKRRVRSPHETAGKHAKLLPSQHEGAIANDLESISDCGTDGTFDARSLHASELFEIVRIDAHVSQYGDD